VVSAKVVPASGDKSLKRPIKDSYFFLIALTVLSIA